jgi:DnaD/phage-associated family protein
MFGALLEEIGEIAELKVVLRGIWLLRRQRSWPRMVAREEFLSDQTLLRGLRSDPDGAAAAISRGLASAVERGIFLAHRPGPGSDARVRYLLNADADRRALARLESEASPASPEIAAEPGWEPVVEPPEERPNIFALYEDNVGMVSPILAEELKEAEAVYPGNWVSDAFKIAVDNNRRNWRYISGILRRWAAEGRPGDTPAARAAREAGGGRKDGEPGRHTAKSDRQKFLEDYQRVHGKASDRPNRS